jgi:uncharacterized tellurite resistance protein B-like protein
MGFMDWLENRLGKASRPAEEPAALGLAVAALLIEVLRADFQVGATERRQVVGSCASLLGLDDAASAELVREAEAQIDEAHDLYQFTSVLNRHWDDAAKAALLESLWRVAQADETVHKYEEHLIRRIADLLHVPHSRFIGSKLRAMEGEPR